MAGGGSGWQQPQGRRLLLRALVPFGLACVLARPPYHGEAQTAIWAARWAKLPDAARRFPRLAPGRYFSVEKDS